MRAPGGCNLCLIIGLTFGLPATAPAGTLESGGKRGEVWLVTPGEKGQPLIVSGVVYSEDGKTPVAGAEVYAYQTDAAGLYHPSGKDPDDMAPRLAGTMTTDAQGRFRFRTIRPGGYPGGRAAIHIHYRVSASGQHNLGGEILFEDDPRLTDQTRNLARANSWPIVTPALGEDGIARCSVVLRLRRNP